MATKSREEIMALAEQIKADPAKRQALVGALQNAQRQAMIQEGMTSPTAGIRSQAFGAALKGFEPPEPGLPEKIAEKAATKAAEQRAIGEEKVRQGKILLDTIVDMFKKTQPIKTDELKMGSALPEGLSRAGRQMLGMQETEQQRNIKAYDNFVKGMRSRLVRSIGQDVGNLSEYEQRTIQELMPVASGPNMDTRETADIKIKALNDFINRIYESREAGKNDVLEMDATANSSANTTFSSVEEAEAANLPVGTVIYINGKKAIVE